MKKNQFRSVLLFALLPLFLFQHCRKAPENESCEQIGEKLLEPRASISLPNNTYSNPRILNGTVWYSGSSTLVGVVMESGAVISVPIPPSFQVLNGKQPDQPYIGTDGFTLIRFKPNVNAWETLYTAPETESIDIDLDLHLDLDYSNGLLPFIEENKTTKIQSITVFELATKRKRDLFNLASLQSQRPFKVRAQPKVFVKNGVGTSADTILATLVKFSDKSTSSILVYSLTRQVVHAEIPLDGLSYGNTLKIGGELAVTTVGALYSETLVMFDPFSGKELWRQTAGGWANFDQDLFKIIDAYLGGYQKINPDNGQAIYSLPDDIDLFSAFPCTQESYCFLGRSTADKREGVQDHLVMINHKGCEVFREKIPNSVLPASSPAYIYYPDSNYILMLDEERNLHFFRPE